MAFDRIEWFQKVLASHREDCKPSPMLVEYIADELAALHAEIAALKAAMPAPEPARETGWAVVDQDGDPFSADGIVLKVSVLDCGTPVIWFEDEVKANVLVRALNKIRVIPARAALLYKDTLEEV